MAFRPAGLSDDEDDLNEFDEYAPHHKKKAAEKPKLNNICDCLLAQDAPALVNCITNSKAKGFEIDYDVIHNDIPLMIACDVPWPEGVKLLLENGANPNVQKELFTPLAKCCIGGPLYEESLAKCAELLLDYGANPNQQDHLGRAPLIIAAISGLPLVIDRLLKNPQIDINFVDPLGWPALFHAKAKGHIDIYEKLIAAGADQGIRTHNRLCLDDVEVTANQREECDSDLTVEDLFCEQSLKDFDCNLEFMNASSLKQVEKLLSNLPDNGGGGGMSDCAGSLLYAAEYDSEQLLSVPSLPDVLMGDEALLERLGVAFTFDRHRIMQAAHRFIITKWESTSLIRIPSKQTLGLGEVGNVLCSYLSQLVTMNASIQYLNRRIDSYHQDSHGLSRNTDLIDLLSSVHETHFKLERQLTAVLFNLNKVRPIQQSKIDYKGSDTKSTPRSLPIKMMVAAVALLGATWLKLFGNSFRNS